MAEIMGPGLYDLIHTEALKEAIEKSGLTDQAQWRQLSKDEAYIQIKEQFASFFAERFSSLFNEKKPELWSQELETFVNNFESEVKAHSSLKIIDSSSLDFILTPSQKDLKLVPEKPDTALANSALLTGSSRTPSLQSQLKKELRTCDRADLLVSFIKWSGLRPILDVLKDFCSVANDDGTPRLRVATTSYMGATDVKAIEALLELPNTEVRISYDTKRTRLHAKAYIFHRKTGFGSAYIGSANVSKAALDEGLEWTAKISQYELEYLWKQTLASFESHWEDDTEFSKCSKGDIKRFEQAIQSEKQSTDVKRIETFFDLHPYDYQKIVLEDIQAERDIGKTKHLVIAATGTGKTMIAAFDYFNYSKKSGSLPSLLFIAHREEILKQSMNTFRQVLRDGSFGDLLTGKHRPTQDKYLFCTVQSWNSQKLNKFDSNHFEYVVLDEAHHASANSYQNVIDHIQTKSLLGLTATPERQDGLDIRNDFDGAFTHEIRLPEAIERSLLCPFHYYGVPDSSDIDYSRLSWQTGSYQTKDLNQLFVNNTRRASWVMSQCQNYLNEWHLIKGLAFCVSVAHAEFMASFFTENNIPSVALSANSPVELRNSVQHKLLKGDIYFIFTVDLFNEGVDIPEVNTVLFLRPTESLTVFLQQLGRGLRLHPNKAQLTILDFIAAQNKNFSFAKRFQSISSRPELRIDTQIIKDMPYLPSGCLIHLEKQAKEHVLNNIREATNMLRGKRMINELRDLHTQLQRRPSLIEIIDRFLLDSPDEIYKKGLPSTHLNLIENNHSSIDKKIEEKLAKGLRNLLLTDDQFLLNEFIRIMDGHDSGKDVRSLLHALLWGQKKVVTTLEEAENFVAKHLGLKNDLKELFQWRQKQIPCIPKKRFPWTGLLNLHASYSREQILLALGMGSFEKSHSSREGVCHVSERKLDVFFVDVNKSEEDYSPTTMYDDYAITERLFHWQSQNATGVETATGQRYINHEEKGYTPLLFVRDKNKLPNGLTSPYVFLGPLKYQKHEGSKPISFVWELIHPMPAKILPWARRIG
ncbi:DEAD/DEAH box helicase-like protein [Lentisphaera araneosa HTCC2155]|uniref:DEAD/DEAH box helicase-like protein n=1 Tax=Lentisphaera araneosa HTCC2155 TaxID=313628 RepID=A6DFM7_9BACT|nr:DEAD/DEAH box helicase [Lentisphaera araneosa]EDM29607.1 DEAD/DEAH box helicase-like protein [Lentisphaera araneosa HTCC2155]